MGMFNLAKVLYIAFLSSFVATIYSSKIKSIVLGADVSSFMIFGGVMLICMALFFTKKDIKEFTSFASKKKNDLEEIPDKIYTFCKEYYLKTDSETIDFIKEDIKNKDLSNFFVRYLDKNNKEEIAEYLSAKELEASLARDNSKKVTSYLNFFLVLSTVSSYIYNSNIKGVLVLATALSVANLFFLKRIDSNYAYHKQIYLLFRNIAEDILNLRGAKYIMYKSKSILRIENEYEYVTVDNIEEERDKELNIESVSKQIELKNDIIEDRSAFGIRPRKTASFKIEDIKNKAKEYNSKKIN